MIKCDRAMRAFLKVLAEKERSKATVYKGPADLLLHEGRAFSVDKAPRLLESDRKLARHCYKVAHSLAMQHRNLRYVEGLVHDWNPVCDGTALRYDIIQHAWCIDEADNIVDKTWRGDCGAGEYVGIVIPAPLAEYIFSVSGRFGALWSQELKWKTLEPALLAGIAARRDDALIAWKDKPSHQS